MKGEKVGEWSIKELYKKMYGGDVQPYTWAEEHAMKFLEEMGYYLPEVKNGGK